MVHDLNHFNSIFQLCPEGKIPVFMDEYFQDYSWIQDFEADFPWKVNLKMLN